MPFVYSERQLGVETGRNEWRDIGSRLPAVMLQSSFYMRRVGGWSGSKEGAWVNL